MMSLFRSKKSRKLSYPDGKREYIDVIYIRTNFATTISHYVDPVSYEQKRSTEGCSKFKSTETRQVQEILVSTLEHVQVPKYDCTNDFGKMPSFVALLMYLLATRADGQTCYRWYRWLLSNQCCQGTRKMNT